jgi:hypothetical protein
MYLYLQHEFVPHRKFPKIYNAKQPRWSFTEGRFCLVRVIMARQTCQLF